MVIQSGGNLLCFSTYGTYNFIAFGKGSLCNFKTETF
jgi:hypothetical protein